MPIKFADVKIREARQALAAVKRELAALPEPAGDLPVDHYILREIREQRALLFRERAQVLEPLQLLLILDEMPPQEMGSA